MDYVLGTIALLTCAYLLYLALATLAAGANGWRDDTEELREMTKGLRIAIERRGRNVNPPPDFPKPPPPPAPPPPVHKVVVYKYIPLESPVREPKDDA